MAFTALIMVIWMDYLVTDIKDITSKRRLVYINYEPAFGLYAGELIAYDIRIDKVIPQNVYDENKSLNLKVPAAFKEPESESSGDALGDFANWEIPIK